MKKYKRQMSKKFDPRLQSIKHRACGANFTLSYFVELLRGGNTTTSCSQWSPDSARNVVLISNYSRETIASHIQKYQQRIVLSEVSAENSSNTTTSRKAYVISLTTLCCSTHVALLTSPCRRSKTDLPNFSNHLMIDEGGVTIIRSVNHKKETKTRSVGCFSQVTVQC
jgi:hypothetical protein